MKRYLLLILLCSAYSLGFAQVEICDNGIDDDFDNLIDLNDEDCACRVTEPVSVIPNPSFEEQDCCPSERAQLNCASDWIQASEATTDYINSCGWDGWDEYLPPQPFPDGIGIMGFRDGRIRNNNAAEPYWKEYAGACLLSPLRKDSSYRFQFDVGFSSPLRSPPIDISFFGTTSCDNLPFGIGDDAFGCPSNDSSWEKLGEVNVSGGDGNIWVNATINIIPEDDIYAIAIGPSCEPISSSIGLYYFFDNLLLANIESFDFEITENEHPCSSDHTFSIPNNPDFDYQWYKEGVALQGEVFSELMQNYGEGTYQVRILNGESCRVSTDYEYVIPAFAEAPEVAICQDDTYPLGNVELSEAGFYLDTLKNVNNCDSVVSLTLSVIGDKFDTIEVSVLEGESFEIGGQSLQEEGDYPVVFTSSLGCDSLVLVKLSNFKIFIPNVFSPNDDGVNDVFQPYALTGLMESIDMKVFDRWGNLVFQGPRWEGLEYQPGVYVYMINIGFVNGTTSMFSGSVTLME